MAIDAKIADRHSMKKTPKKYMGYTEADEIYYKLISQGIDSKTAAKKAQNSTGLSLLTGQRMRSKGFGWQTSIERVKV